jgi:hypothetical protein
LKALFIVKGSEGEGGKEILATGTKNEHLFNKVLMKELGIEPGSKKARILATGAKEKVKYSTMKCFENIIYSERL